MASPADQPGWFQCRRSKKCRASLPAHELLRNQQSGEFECLPGKCPNDLGPGGQELVQKDIEIRQLRDQKRTLERDRNRLVGMVDAEQEKLRIALQIQTDKIETVRINRKDAKNGKSETVPILMCSDWHFGAVVRPQDVNGLNEYNLEVAHERSAALFRNTLRIVTMLRSTAEVNRIAVWLGGDLIDNWIHPEQAQTQELSPTQQLIEVEKAVIAAINLLLASGDFDEILIPCSFGNHGRTTQKMQSNGYQTSYEWLMYQSLQRHYRKEPRAKFLIAETNSLYMNIFGNSLRFMHGDCIRYQGGTGGVHVPLIKWIDRANRSIRADHTFLGHFHQVIMGSNYSVNSSLCGALPYAMRAGYGCEPPQQLLRCIDSERGFTIAAPVFVDK